MTKKIPVHYRQGDVLLVSANSIPSDAKSVDRDKNGRLVLANGEVTGHAHVFHPRGVCGYSKLDSRDIEFLLVDCGGSGATLKHELVSGAQADHDPQHIPDGIYRLGQQVEYTPAELIRSAD